MKKASVTLASVSNYSQSRHYEVPKLPKELFGDYEKRTWRERMHVNSDGYVFIPPMSFKNCISEIAKYRGDKIPGKRNATYTKHFESGVLVLEGPVLPIKKDDVPGEWLFVPSDGKRGGGSRVSKCFPLIAKWEVEVVFYILDETITDDVFQAHLRDAGNFIGLGRFRPSRNGFYGRFRIEKFRWEEYEG